MGKNVETFLSKFIIVWVDREFEPKNKHYAELNGHINELNGYEFTKCKPFENSADAVKLMGKRTCADVILISSGGMCIFPAADGKGNLLD